MQLVTGYSHPIKGSDTVEYYRNFDFIRLMPENKIDKKDELPFLKIIKDSAGIKQIETYLTNRQRPTKIYYRIYFKGFRAFKTSSKLLSCTTIDTLISIDNTLFEFRNCYSNISKSVNEQDFFYYKKQGTDSVSLDYMRFHNLYRDADKQLFADTSSNIFNTNVGRHLSVNEKYLMVKEKSSLRIYCKTKTTPWCQSGEEDKRLYPFRGCFYWSLFSHPYWQVMTK